ncbi:hypothetical protein ABEB36_011844 [Hypothenemus hampei]|uniref:Uncharacterized protein n=1 Tax=Hypothenemus hampei TaxID=57062 RepID=A0ABD1E986_HYPHA
MFSSISGAAVESEGCPIPVGDSVCGETNSLEIMKEFNQLYEERMKDVDMAGGDCLKEKIKLQEEWIRNLIQQNEMLVKAVQELEYEATERVHQLEQKLQKSAQCLCEGEKILNRKDETIQDLTQKLNYYNSFGDVATMAQELQLRKVECDSLKQDMIDMREALTEEVAAKHDEIMALRREVQALEERCVQADKQTAFKEDIIKELRKEIKQLKFTQEEVSKLNSTIDQLRHTLEKTRSAQDEEEKAHERELALLNETINSLEEKVLFLEEKQQKKEPKACRICKVKSKVGFLEHSETQANLTLAGGECEELLKELNETKRTMESELEKRNEEIHTLKKTIQELELALSSCQERGTNLNEAVAFYTNSLRVLEESESETHLQIEQQKVTIANLQKALVGAKKDVEEMRKKNQENVAEKREMLEHLQQIQLDNELINKMVVIRHREFESLQDVNFELEIEHCDSLQDLDTLEVQLSKYKGLNQANEEQMKRLSKQKRCYEEVIAYFKHEMGLMADQLNNLQELLTLSNESAQEETSKVMQAFLEVQSLNDKLSSQLCACEQTAQLEGQMNQLHETKINELQRLLQEKDLDLTKHDQAILNIRKTLNDSLKQNEQLQETIVELNDTVAKLQRSVKDYEQETCAAKNSCSEFQEQIDSYQKKFDKLKRSLEDKTAECLKLEMAYNNEKRALKTAQKQLQEAEKARQDHQKELINSLDEFKIKLECSEQNYEKFLKECEDLRAQLASLTRKEAVKDLEIKRYRKIVGDLKATMMELNTELNKNLAQKALKSSCKNANCRANMESSPDNVCLSCPCEVEFYQNMVDILKQSVKELKRKLIESQQKCTELESDLKLRATQADELKSGRDKAIIELQREVDHLNQELQVKDLQLSDVKKSANEINGSKCVQLACAQEEIASLKSQIANLLNRQYLLKRENDDLHSQNSQFHCTVNCLNEKVRLLKEQIDQHLVIIKSLNMEKDTLIRKNRELLNELRSIQALTASMDKQQRFTSVDKQQLELDFEQLKCTKDDLCSESQNVIKNVRAWVLEQKKINSFVIKREKELIETIRRLSGGGGVKDRIPPCHHMCSSPCSLGSQGAGSMLESPPPSPDLNTVEWYSSTFRADSENDSEDDYCVNTLENLTEQMRRSNKMWMKESRVSRDQIKEKK